MKKLFDYTHTTCASIMLFLAIFAQFDGFFAILVNMMYMVPLSVAWLISALFAEKVLTKRNAFDKIRVSLNQYKQRNTKNKTEEQPHESTKTKQKNSQQNQQIQANGI